MKQILILVLGLACGIAGAGKARTPAAADTTKKAIIAPDTTVQKDSTAQNDTTARKDSTAAKPKKKKPSPSPKKVAVAPAPPRGTEIYGVVEEELRLKPEQNPIRLTGSLWVLPNAVLTISEGCTVIVAREPRRHLKAIDTLPGINRKLVTVRVDGSLICNGLPHSRIRILPEDTSRPATWKGIEIGPQTHEFTCVSYTDIRGAMYALTLQGCEPRVHHNILHYNETAIRCLDGAKPEIYHNIICYNQNCGLYNQESTPNVFNNIIAFNGNNAIVSDDKARIIIEYNCFYGNRDGDFSGVEGSVGPRTQLNETKRDSADKFENIYADPLFAGSPGHRRAEALDKKLPTDTARVSDKKLGRQISADAASSQLVKAPPAPKAYQPYELSPYSPGIDAGKRDSDFRDYDGSPADLGVYGGSK